MVIDVEYNADSRITYLDPIFTQWPHLEAQLKAEFIYCKSTGHTTDTFGHDAIFTGPPYAVSANLSRFHIKLPDETPWPPRTPDAKKKSDTYLVYSEHDLLPGKFSIIAVVRPAHTKMTFSNTQLISKFSGYAERFFEKF